MTTRFCLFCLLAAGALGILACAPTTETQPPPLIPMEDFFKNPEMTGHDLSDDGEHIAFLMPWNSRLNVHVQKVGEAEARRITESTERDIIGFAWASPDRIVYIQDRAGDENWRVYAVGIDGSNLLDLTPFEGVQARIVDTLDDNDDEIIISLNNRDPRVHDVYRVNTQTGEMVQIAENPGNIMGWMTDNKGRLRGAIATDGVNRSLLYRTTEDQPFRTIATMNFKERLAPLYFTFDDEKLYVSSNLGRDKAAIYLYDPETAELGELIYEHPEVDVERVLRSRKRQVITGVAFTTDMRQYHFFDEWRGNLQASLEAKLPGVEVAVASMSLDETKVLVRTYSDKTLGSYYFYNVPGDELTKLVDVAPWLKEGQMADQMPIQYTSRDGLTIHGYLTTPRGVEAKNLPVVVNPHGGPWYRDSWGFNPEVQFLANRGYAVLQMNFRGSTGYGKAFWEASFKQWGRTMQDDISDGVKWLIAEGIADPEKIAIYGASYGGYATLAGLTFTPELYACGVDYVGVSNMFTFMASIPPYWEPMRDMFHEMVGNPETEKEMLEAASPSFHVDKIQAPLLVAQGANDPRVNKAESDQIVEALRARGIDVPYMVKDNEGHGFLLEENRFDFYRAMEQFLAKHLGGRAEAVAAATEAETETAH